jgi:hypothetical protein
MKINSIIFGKQILNFPMMRKIFYLGLILCSNIFFSNAQTDLKKILKEIEKTDSIVWFGLDFSNAKFIGEFSDRKYIMSSLLDEWNSVIVSTDMLKLYKSTSFLYDFSIASKKNKQVKEEDLFATLPMSLTVDRIQSLINNYDPIIKKGKGLVFFIESFDKNREEAKVWFTYFDIATKKVIYAQSFTGRASGVTMANHWANAIYRIISTTSLQNKPVFETIMYLLLVSLVAMSTYLFFNKGL